MNSGPTISMGSSGADVRRLQRLLVEMKLLDFPGIDGSFGPNTDGAVRSFQQSAGLVDDGIVGPLTWGALPADPNTPLLSQGRPVARCRRSSRDSLPTATKIRP
jgi:peptidoglycan hydrolase-like protein with peptidoglycan-binding domain